jgi:hypothetical protein
MVFGVFRQLQLQTYVAGIVQFLCVLCILPLVPLGIASAHDASAHDASAHDANAHDASAHDASAQSAGAHFNGTPCCVIVSQGRIQFVGTRVYFAYIKKYGHGHVTSGTTWCRCLPNARHQTRVPPHLACDCQA